MRTSLDPEMQDAAAEALREGLAKLRRRPRLARPRAERRLSTATGAAQLDRAPVGTGFPDWRKAVVLSKSGGEATIGFTDGTTGTLPRLGGVACPSAAAAARRSATCGRA